MESSHPEPLRAKRAKVHRDTPSPTPTFVDEDDGSAIVIDFQEDQVLITSCNCLA